MLMPMCNANLKAIQYAGKHGVAIVIGHPRKNTVAVLKAGLGNLPKDIQLVGIGSLWRNEKSGSAETVHFTV